MRVNSTAVDRSVAAFRQCSAAMASITVSMAGMSLDVLFYLSINSPLK